MLGHDYIPQDSGGMKGNLLRGLVNYSGAVGFVAQVHALDSGFFSTYLNAIAKFTI